MQRFHSEPSKTVGSAQEALSLAQLTAQLIRTIGLRSTGSMLVDALALKETASS